MTDLVICSYSRERLIGSYSQINMVWMHNQHVLYRLITYVVMTTTCTRSKCFDEEIGEIIQTYFQVQCSPFIGSFGVCIYLIMNFC